MMSKPLPDVTPITTHMLEVLPSRRLRVTVMDIPPGLGLSPALPRPHPVGHLRSREMHAHGE